MEQPLHDLRAHAPTAAANTGRRTGILIAVGVLHVGLAYALIAGLASGLIEKLPDEIKAEVVKPKDEVKPPPPPPPDMAKPPPPFVPPPEINIATDAPSTNAITTQSVVPTPPAPPPQPAAPAPTQLSPIARTHTIPPYPELSRKLNEQGSVTLEVTINENGDCTDAAVQTSSGSQRLDDAAVQWVKARWRWNPPTQNGKPTSARTLVKVTFNLKNG